MVGGARTLEGPAEEGSPVQEDWDAPMLSRCLGQGKGRVGGGPGGGPGDGVAEYAVPYL